MRKLFWILLILAIFGGGYGLWQSRAGQGAIAADVLVTEQLRRTTFRRTVLATGSIEAARLVSVGAQVGGQIQALPVELGQMLEPGDLIAQIDPEDQQTDLLRAEASMAQINAQITASEASLTEARLNLERRRQLNRQSLVSQAEIEALEAQFAVAEANLAALKANRAQSELAVQSARIALERTRILAPAGGTVVALVAREGQTINANQSSPTLVKIADLSRMLIKVDISEADIIAVRPGQKAEFTLSGASDMKFEAVLRAIEPAPASIASSDEIDTSSAIYYRALLEVPNPDGILRIGMTAEVVIVLEELQGVLVLPTAAVITGRDGQKSVRVPVAASGDTPAGAELRQVSIGPATASQTVILSGLDEGERVLTGTRAAGRSGGASGSGGGGFGPGPGAGGFGGGGGPGLHGAGRGF